MNMNSLAKCDLQNKCSDLELNRLMSEYGNYVLRLCYFYTKDLHLAEDIFQEVYFKVYKNYNKFNHNSSEKTWITKIASNTCKSYLRNSWFKRILLQEKLPNDVYEEVEKVFFEQEEQRLIIKEILALDIKYREVVLLYYYNALSIKEIASILSITETNVRVRLNRSRQKLKLRLEEEFKYAERRKFVSDNR